MSALLAKPSGFALVAVLMVIAVLTVLGIVALDIATVNLEIASSHKETRESFYLAEAAAMEGIQRLLNRPVIDRKECFLYWHHDLATMEKNNLDFTKPENWQTTELAEINAFQSELDPSAFMVAAEQRVASGSSLIVTDSRLYINRVYGLCTKHNADDIVQVGYYMRY